MGGAAYICTEGSGVGELGPKLRGEGWAQRRTGVTTHGVSVAGEAGRGRREGGKPKPSLRLHGARHCPRGHPPRGDDLVHRRGGRWALSGREGAGVRRTDGRPPPQAQLQPSGSPS